MGKAKERDEPTGPAGNCLDCAFHRMIPDPEPDDWFCADDVAVVCTKVPNPDQKPESRWLSDRAPFRSVAWSCRPHKVQEDTGRPSWCPLLN